MSLRECFNAIEGYSEAKREELGAFFEIARFGAFYNVFSNDQAKAIKRARNPYIKHKRRRASNENIGKMLSALAKAFDGNG